MTVPIVGFDTPCLRDAAQYPIAIRDPEVFPGYRIAASEHFVLLQLRRAVFVRRDEKGELYATINEPKRRLVEEVSVVRHARR